MKLNFFTVFGPLYVVFGLANSAMHYVPGHIGYITVGIGLILFLLGWKTALNKQHWFIQLQFCLLPLIFYAFSQKKSDKTEDVKPVKSSVEQPVMPAMDQPETVFISAINAPWQEGDLIFQSSQSAQSQAIELATKSPISHMGFIRLIGSEFFVYEAIQPVRLTPMKEWTERGKNGEFWVKRLKDETLLTDANLSRLKKAGEPFKGKDYDIYFNWDDKQVYCSELVWKMYKRALDIEIGQPQKLREFDLSSPEVKEIMQKRYGSEIPLDELVISPVAMFESNLLQEIDITKMK